MGRGAGVGIGIRATLAAALCAGMVAACSSDEAPPSDPAATCADVPNGTTAAAPPAGQAPPPAGAPPTSQNLATNPEIATVYRSGMVPVDTASYAVSTANPISTQAACDVLREGAPRPTR